MDALFKGLGINLPSLIAFLVNFLILFGLLGFLLYKPLLKMLDDRAGKVKESLEAADRMKEQAVKSEQAVKEQIDLARKEGQAMIAQAVQAGDRIKVEAREEARKETEAAIARARAEIQHEREETIDQLRRQFADIALLAAEKVINETLDKQKHRKVIDEVLAKSPELKG